MFPASRLVPPLALAIMVLTGCGDGGGSPLAPTTVTSPVTATFASAVTATGGAFQFLHAAQPGTVTVTLVSTAPADAELGLGIGVPGGGSCVLTVAARTRASAAQPLSIDVDEGEYCAGVFSLGSAGDPQIHFDVRINHP